jgi:hypothetical protein
MLGALAPTGVGRMIGFFGDALPGAALVENELSPGCYMAVLQTLGWLRVES